MEEHYPLAAYVPVVGREVIDDLRRIASCIDAKKIQHVNSTKAGGGVAEILNRMLPLMDELGLQSRWDVIKGDADFFEATKAFHNSLQTGESIATHEMFEDYLRKTEENLREIKIVGDTIFIHDPQPVGLVQLRKHEDNGSQRWIWRCHIDVSRPEGEVWNFLSKYIKDFDAAIFSTPGFGRPDLHVPQFMVAPSIDPLSDKNRGLPQTKIDRILSKYDIDPDLPIITQISRFDYAKDPVGVIEAFKMVGKHIDCQLVLGGSLADDDPERTRSVRQSSKGCAGK